MARARRRPTGASAARSGRAPAGRCAVCRRRKEKIHRSRKTRKLVCRACADRARMQVGSCADCGQRKLLQARGRCYACYKRQWRTGRGHVMARPARRRRRRTTP